MITRNEAAVIERCLDSVAAIADLVSVCDTGSTDGSPEIVERWLGSREIPGEVRCHAWRDFGFNRTLAIRAAQRLLRRRGFDPATTYLLFIDADMTLEVAQGFDPARLEADVYRVVQVNGNLRYPNVRLMRASVPGRFVGMTHEYFDCPSDTRSADCEELQLFDHNDGGSRADKFERDIDLLEKELARDPGNVRAMFYLAQSYRAVGDRGRALFWYLRRIASGGWEEERWYSQYMIGRMHLEAGDVLAGVKALHESIRMDPARAEPFQALANWMRDHGHFRFAAFYAEKGLAIPEPRDRRLFIEDDVYRYGLTQELAVAAYSTPSPEPGFAACEKLALGRDIPEPIRYQAAANEVFYAGTLGGDLIKIAPAMEAFERPCNPSILRLRDGYLMSCRAVSYEVDPYQRYHSTSPDGLYRTRTAFLKTDRALGFKWQRFMSGEPEPLRATLVRGFEDARIFRFNGGLAALATSQEHHPSGLIQMSLLLLDRTGRILHHKPLWGFGDELVQKNWLPFVDRDGGLRALYSYEPTVVLAIDSETGKCTAACTRSSGRGLTGWRGSAGPIGLPDEQGGGWLAVVHQALMLGRRYYLHRFVRFDRDWNLVAVSRPFYMLRRGIEFVCGLCLAHGGDHLLLSFGVNDGEAWLLRKPLNVVLDLLHFLP